MKVSLGAPVFLAFFVVVCLGYGANGESQPAFRTRRDAPFSVWNWIAGKFGIDSTPAGSADSFQRSVTNRRNPSRTTTTTQAPTTTGVPGQIPLRLCSWNVFRFGPAKFSVPDLLIQAGKNVSRMDIIIDQLSNCDIAAMQEYMDPTGSVMEKLRLNLVATTGHQFKVLLSPRVGHGTSLEQYVFIYRGDKVVPLQSRLYPDNKTAELFVRDPFFATFKLLEKAPGKAATTEFVLGTIHTAPEDAVQEISSLVLAFDWATKNFSNPNVMVLGDYNAACSYVRVRDWPTIPLFTQTRFTWIVPTTMDTTSMTTKCAYDRAVYLGSKFRDSYVAQSVVAPDFALKFGLTPAQAKLVSDHLMIQMNFLF